MIATHTPGPWESVTPPSTMLVTRRITTPDGRDIASVGLAGGYNLSTREDEANARLIAAAPDLLKACQECLKQDEWSGTGLSSQNLILLRKAVAKATS